MNLEDTVTEIANAIVHVDRSRVAFKGFQPGVGPYGEPQLVRLIAARLNEIPNLAGTVSTKRTPDLLIRGSWAVEFKIVRPYGDNGREAENWSVNLLHPYVGNISSIADCWKLENLRCARSLAVQIPRDLQVGTQARRLWRVGTTKVFVTSNAAQNRCTLKPCALGVSHFVTPLLRKTPI